MVPRRDPIKVTKVFQVCNYCDRKQISFTLLLLHRAIRIQIIIFLFCSQVDKDAILICYGKTVKIVTMEGNPRQSRKLVSHLDFDFTIESIGE